MKAGEITPEVKQSAARGVLPVSREELIEVLVLLADDPDAEISRQARDSLSAFPTEVLGSFLQSSFTPAAVLGFFCRPPFPSSSLLEVALQNIATPDEAVARIADQVEAPLIEIILVNLMRLLRDPSVLEALERNPNNTADTRRRLGEIREEFFVKRNTFVPVTPLSYAEVEAVGRAPAEAAPSPPEEQHPATTDEPAEKIVESVSRLMAEDGEVISPEHLTTLQRIARMTVSERVQLALKGSRDERLILIRDANKIVSRAVLQSPKISENEVEWIAQMRNVNEEVLRLVGTSRAWVKNYAVIHNLVRNSRTPVAISLGLLNRILKRDLRNLSRNKGIPEVVRRSSQRLFTLREQGRD